jgi:YrbI family 3-deoxy-D-manno-octulosonate 8-phosphate phosphatase
MLKKSLSSADFKKIKLLLTDIDGVWTDGGLYYTVEGQNMLKFNVKDGMGVNLLRLKGIETGIITGNASEVVMTRAKKLKLEVINIGIPDKIIVYEKILAERNLKDENVAYIGDDVNDLELMSRAAITAAPCDAMPVVLGAVDYICERKGGDGSFREFAELILANLD